MAKSEEWMVSVIKGDELRKLIVSDVNYEDLEHCLWFIRENASGDEIGEEEYEMLMKKFCSNHEVSAVKAK